VSGFVCLTSGPDEHDIDPLLLRTLTDAMAFRGPHGSDTWHEGRVGIGHALLRSTAEQVSERQPLSLDGTTWIAADARVDGRPQLISELRAQGRLITDDATDPELLLHAYHAWGKAFLDHVIGDFAFALWDGPQRTLLCAHDHFGVVPLYYARVGRGVAITNTLPILLRHPEVSPQLNEQAIGDSLVFGMNMDTSTTTFAGIQRLPPGHLLTWSETGIRVTRYWSPPPDGDYLRYRREDEYVDEFRDLFRRAVADRLRTDAVGTHLSGGLDASSIAVTAVRVLRESGRAFDLRAYTIVYERLLRDEEGRFAKEVAASAGLPLELFPAEPYFERAPIEQPPHLPSEPLLLPGKSAELDIHDRVVSFGHVLLVGFGGDPLFEYDPAYVLGLLRRRQVRPLLTDAAREIRMGRVPRLGVRTALRRRAGRSQPPRDELPEWLDADFVDRTGLRQRSQAIFDAIPDRGRSGMANAPLWSNIFAWSDAGFTGLPLKVRFPFFDIRLVRFMTRVPPAPWLREKTLLRLAMRDQLPPSVLARPKTPLQGNPLWNMVDRDGIPGWMMALLEDAAIAPYVAGERLSSLLRSSAVATPRNLNHVWNAVTLAYWLRHGGSGESVGGDGRLLSG
jgi:asparagine synthase (glutamine-hydrolysing)